MRVIQKLKIQNVWKGKGNHLCEGGNTVVSSILPFPFVFAFTGHLADQKFHEDEEVTYEVTAWLCAQVAELYDIRIQKLIPRLNKCLERGGDYVEKQLMVCVKSFFHLILLINIF